MTTRAHQPSATRINYRKRAPLVGTFALLASSACSAGDDVNASDGSTDSRPAITAVEPNAPAAPEANPAPEASPEELLSLANSPEVFLQSFPFFDVPASDADPTIEMSDGVRLAASLYFPDGAARDAANLPSVYVDEWYGRNDESVGTAIDIYRRAGFVVALVDARGYGASFGSQPAFLTQRARADQAEVLAWLAEQAWSNGAVSAVGLSLSGSLASVMTGSGSPHLRAAVLRAADFDQYTDNMYPGGVPNTNMQEAIAGFTRKVRGEPCIDDVSACADLGIAPAGGDADLALLREAFAEHASNVDGAALAQAIYHDDALGDGLWSAMTPSEHPEARVPTRVWASWVDGLTANSALELFESFPSTPMEVVIGATTHMGGLDADPFSQLPFQIARPEPLQAFADDAAFLQRVLDGDAIGRAIRYRILGTDTWLTTTEWPPRDVRYQAWSLSRNELVAGVAPTGESIHRVDPAASTGPLNRWASQRATPVHYGDRRNATGLLSFDSPPADGDTLIAGAAELCLVMSSDQPDGVVIAYLEDVAPDGRVTYLTEGELRLLHRGAAGSGCDPAPGTARSFNRADARPVTAGEIMHLEIPLASTAALLREGHQLRLSLAGADAGTFPALTDQPATWTLDYGGEGGASLRVPARPWTADDRALDR
jgi:uncharacterized protein